MSLTLSSTLGKQTVADLEDAVSTKLPIHASKGEVLSQRHRITGVVFNAIDEGMAETKKEIANKYGAFHTSEIVDDLLNVLYEITVIYGFKHGLNSLRNSKLGPSNPGGGTGVSFEPHYWGGRPCTGFNLKETLLAVTNNPAISNGLTDEDMKDVYREFNCAFEWAWKGASGISEDDLDFDQMTLFPANNHIGRANVNLYGVLLLASLKQVERDKKKLAAMPGAMKTAAPLAAAPAMAPQTAAAKEIAKSTLGPKVAAWAEANQPKIGELDAIVHPRNSVIGPGGLTPKFAPREEKKSKPQEEKKEKFALPFVPTRLAYVPGNHIFDARNPEKITPLDAPADLFNVAKFARPPEAVTNRAPKLSSGHYVARTITEGYVYMYRESGGWKAFKASSSGTFSAASDAIGSKTPVGFFKEDGEMITIEDADKVNTTWVGYSRVKWTDAVLTRLEKEAVFRKELMVKISVSSVAQGGSVLPEVGFRVGSGSDLSKHVQEYRMNQHQVTEDVYGYVKTHVDPEKQASLDRSKEADATSDRMWKIGEKFGGVVLVLNDAVGVVQDLNVWLKENKGLWVNFQEEHVHKVTIAGVLKNLKAEVDNEDKKIWKDKFEDNVNYTAAEQELSNYKKVRSNALSAINNIDSDWVSWFECNPYIAAINSYDAKDKEAGSQWVNDAHDTIDGTGKFVAMPTMDEIEESKEEPVCKSDLVLEKVLEEIVGDYEALAKVSKSPCLLTASKEPRSNYRIYSVAISGVLDDENGFFETWVRKTKGSKAGDLYSFADSVLSLYQQVAVTTATVKSISSQFKVLGERIAEWSGRVSPLGNKEKLMFTWRFLMGKAAQISVKETIDVAGGKVMKTRFLIASEPHGKAGLRPHVFRSTVGELLDSVEEESRILATEKRAAAQVKADTSGINKKIRMLEQRRNKLKNTGKNTRRVQAEIASLKSLRKGFREESIWVVGFESEEALRAAGLLSEEQTLSSFKGLVKWMKSANFYWSGVGAGVMLWQITESMDSFRNAITRESSHQLEDALKAITEFSVAASGLYAISVQAVDAVFAARHINKSALIRQQLRKAGARAAIIMVVAITFDTVVKAYATSQRGGDIKWHVASGALAIASTLFGIAAVTAGGTGWTGIGLAAAAVIALAGSIFAGVYAMINEPSELEAWAYHCTFGDDPEYTDLDIELFAYQQARFEVRADARWNYEIVAKDVIELDITIPTFQHGKSMVGYAVYLIPEDNPDQKVFLYGMPCSLSKDPDINWTRKENEPLEKYGKNVSSLEMPKQSSDFSKGYVRNITIKDEDKFDRAIVKIEYYPDAGIPDFVIYPPAGKDELNEENEIVLKNRFYNI